MTADHYIILIVAALSICWVIISLIGMLESKKRRRAKKTWGKLTEVSERLRVEKNLKTWESLSSSNEKNENIL